MIELIISGILFAIGFATGILVIIGSIYLLLSLPEISNSLQTGMLKNHKLLVGVVVFIIAYYILTIELPI